MAIASLGRTLRDIQLRGLMVYRTDGSSGDMRDAEGTPGWCQARSRRRWRGRACGQSIVEFTLVLPIFLLLVFGTVDLGRLVFYQSMINNSVRDGARLAIVAGTADTCTSGTCAATTAVQTAAGMFASQLTICSAAIYTTSPLTTTPACSSSGSSTDQFGYVTVSASMPFSPATALFGNAWQITLHSQSTMMFSP